VNNVRVAGRAARCARERDEQQRQRERQPRPAAEVAHDAVAGGDAEVPEIRRRDNVDLDASCAQTFDGVGDEAAGRVSRRARIRRRQDDDLHAGLTTGNNSS
jgi:hypothetical protein